ncbi:hypothetical protein LI177_11850 [bacterium 210820-DFI.6.37]|nr:hypothetical protein [bacterium 210820-DFI.6.37]
MRSGENLGRELSAGRNAERNQACVPWVCAGVVAVFLAVLLLPGSREVFRLLSASHPMVMGFIKFALLATIGELLAGRITRKCWELPYFLTGRMLIWGVIGAVLAFMLKLYSGGTAFLLSEGLLPGQGSLFVKAAATSILMNITFGPVMMAFHKMTDKYLELRHQQLAGPCLTPGRLSIGKIAEAVDWNGFYSFVVMRTIPVFWFPAHTVTFMLPAEYQTIMAAFLSMALGVILSLRKG